MFAYLPLFLLIVSKYAATASFVTLGATIGAVYVSKVRNVKMGDRSALSTISSTDLWYGALILVGLTLILIFYYSSVMDKLK
jgi:hypothetical protein